MKEVIRYRWRTLWLGKWGVTRYHATEEEIRKTNPEAVKLEHTREVILVAETSEEIRSASTSAFFKGSAK